VDSGFNVVKPYEYKPRLLHIKGEKTCRVMQVPYTAASLNEGDVFILDAGLKLWQWNGPHSNIAERRKALEMIHTFKEMRNGRPESIVLDGMEEDKEFWGLLGGMPKKLAPETMDKQLNAKKRLMRLSDEEGKMTFMEVASGDVCREHLDSNDVFVFDVMYQLFVWIGSKSSVQEKKRAMLYATQYLEANNLPFETPVVRVVEGSTTKAFDEAFKTSGHSVVDTDGRPVATTTPGVLMVQAHSGEGLHNSAIIGKQDPFAKVKVGKKKQKSEIHTNGGVTPIWTNAPFYFELNGTEEEVCVDVFDSGLVHDKRLGSVALPIKGLLTNAYKAVRATHPLLRKVDKPAGTIELSTTFVPPLKVTVIKAKDLPKVQMIGKQDPYCKLKLGHYRYRTMTHSNGAQAPEWHEENEFVANNCLLRQEEESKGAEDEEKGAGPGPFEADASFSLEIKVKNHNIVRDASIAWASIPIRTLEQQKPGTQVWYPLSKSKEDSSAAGSILLEVARPE